MASNPFFSGRIPPELYQEAEKYCQETGKSKTELLIEALSDRLNFPVTLPGKSFAIPDVEVNREMFEKLEERVKFLETLLNVNGNLVIINDNSDNKNEQSEEIITDNAAKVDDNSSDSKDPEKSNQEIIKTDNSTDNQELQIEKNKPESQTLKLTPELPKFEEIFTTEVMKKTKLTRSQVDYLMSKAIEKIRTQGRNIKPGKLLEEAIEVFNKSGIKVDEHPYRLFYAGENFKEKAVWNLIPDNASYQPVFIKVGSPENMHDNNNYHSDNNQNIMGETVDLTDQEAVEKDADEQD
jgi:hypothetical protein